MNYDMYKDRTELIMFNMTHKKKCIGAVNKVYWIIWIDIDVYFF